MEINELFELKLKEPDIQRAIKLHTSKLRYKYGHLDILEVQNIALIALWKSLKRFGNHADIIPIFCKRMKWEYLSYLNRYHPKSKQVDARLPYQIAVLPKEEFEDIVDGLCDKNKRLLYNRYMMGMTLKEIASIEQCSIEWANLLIKDAIKDLKKCILMG